VVPYPGEFEVHSEVLQGHLTVRLGGGLDITSAPQLSQTLLLLSGVRTRGITLDLSKLEFMDSTGLYAVVSALELCRERGYGFWLIPGPRGIQGIFEQTGLIHALPFQSHDAHAADISRPGESHRKRPCAYLAQGRLRCRGPNNGVSRRRGC
jgi:anti-anti-sigma factor